jgi:hypothetical protein
LTYFPRGVIRRFANVDCPPLKIKIGHSER